jgi:hypothetical protein
VATKEQLERSYRVIADHFGIDRDVLRERISRMKRKKSGQKEESKVGQPKRRGRPESITERDKILDLAVTLFLSPIDRFGNSIKPLASRREVIAAASRALAPNLYGDSLHDNKEIRRHKQAVRQALSRLFPTNTTTKRAPPED